LFTSDIGFFEPWQKVKKRGPAYPNTGHYCGSFIVAVIDKR
jgi:hypothetical protein